MNKLNEILDINIDELDAVDNELTNVINKLINSKILLYLCYSLLICLITTLALLYHCVSFRRSFSQTITRLRGLMLISSIGLLNCGYNIYRLCMIKKYVKYIDDTNSIIEYDEFIKIRKGEHHEFRNSKK